MAVKKLHVHHELNKRLADTESKILDQVNGSMSDSDRARLDSQFQSYEKQMHEANRPYDLTIRLRPEPGSGIDDYYKKVEETTDQYLQQHA